MRDTLRFEGTKREQYKELVAVAKKHYASGTDTFTYKGGEHKLLWEDDYNCNEINLWTYWQGRASFDEQGDVHTEILLVGKDFGEIKEETVTPGLAAQMNGLDLSANVNWEVCETGGKPSKTDVNLACLFEEMSHGRYKILEEKYPELFFTNYVTGYREKGLSGGNMAGCLKRAEPFFEALVHILEPRVILCLGRDVYEGAAASLGFKPREGSYNKVIDGGAHVVETDLGAIAVFPLAHPGGMGTANRNRALKRNKGNKTHLALDGYCPLALQIADWKRVGEYLDALN